MSTTLPYTRIQPSSGDNNTTWMQAISDTIAIDDSHNHNGVNSAKLTSGAISKEAVVVKSTGDWSGSAGAYTLTLSASDIPSTFREAGTSSSELCNVVVMDSDNSDDQVYVEKTWSNSGASAQLVLTSAVSFNCKILFV